MPRKGRGIVPERMLSPVLCGHFCTHTPPNYQQNPRENMRKAQRGFIPLMAIILLGILAVAGGTIATISIRHNQTAQQEVRATSTPEQVGTATNTAYSAPVQARVESSHTPTTVTADSAAPAPVAQISPILDADAKAICDNVGPASNTLTKANSAKETTQLLCKRLNTSESNTPEQQKAWQQLADSIKQKGKLWLPTWDTSLLQIFIANPTPDGYKALCAKGTNVQVPFMTKQTLSSDRTTEVTIPKTLADVMQCDLLSERYVALSVIPGLLQWDFAGNDTDYIRQQKIEYAQNLSEMISTSKIIVLDPGAVADLDPTTKHVSANTSYSYSIYTPDICAQQLLSNRTASGSCSTVRSLLGVIGKDR